MSRQPAQVSLFVTEIDGSSAAARESGSRYDPVDPTEGAQYGRALLARMRKEPLSPLQQALLAQTATEAPAEQRAPTPVVDLSQTLLTLGRGEDAEVRLSLRRYKGSRPFFDIRRWERTDGELRATRQGITIRARELPRLLGALTEAAARIAAGGE